MKITNGNEKPVELRTIKSFQLGDTFRISDTPYLIIQGDRYLNLHTFHICTFHHCRTDPCAIPIDAELIYKDKE